MDFIALQIEPTLPESCTRQRMMRKFSGARTESMVNSCESVLVQAAGATYSNVMEIPGQAVARSALEGRKALVMGGSGGIGAAAALCLSARGAEVTIQGRNPEKLAAALAILRGGGKKAQGFALTIGSASEFIAAISDMGHFDIIVAAFGPFIQKSLGAHTAEDWELMTSLNLALPGALASHFFPPMQERGFGRMLFFGGTRTDTARAVRSNVAYAAAKTGLNVLVKSLAAEGASSNVAALAVCPGFVGTEYLSAAAAQALAERSPGGRLSAPMDIAAAAVALLDMDPCIASGSVIALDGGLTI